MVVHDVATGKTTDTCVAAEHVDLRDDRLPVDADPEKVSVSCHARTR